ncbi:MAG: phenylalanine--tRNA ligase subunit alpha, partial [Parvibaculales bacterium]
MGEMQKMETESISAIEKAETLESLEGLRVAYLGKKGSISALLQGLKDMSQAERVEKSKPLNEMKNVVAAAIAKRKDVLEGRLLSEKLKEETMDVSLPAPQNGMAVGRIHPLSRAMEDIYEIAAQFGFRLAHGPDIESEYYNFTALNIPEHHPARQMHDSFYFPKGEGDEERLLLRTHTSP